MPDPDVEHLNASAIAWSAPPEEFELDIVRTSSMIEKASAELRAVVGSNASRLDPGAGHAVELFSDIVGV